ncbi:hypothetical protein DFJ58DRAFT_668807 [Suillus subalutaceus]|uniref:uncharacterized protein n=1 Tax=Suillus subalutaceus TaxID=48586 RepID=UPI001B86652D|nr:uncharacterized protein DFJ58DRAFT_668807 [Suillus subalutaceus]KAG1837640.1 hypothetical protein DFJ58DRAFT_668807 [Suillus subalutaceus]
MGADDNLEAAAIVTINALREVLNAHQAESACPSHKDLIVCAALDKASQDLTHLERADLLQLNVTALKLTTPLPKYVALFEGMPVILRSQNLSTELGVTNGTQGIVQKIFTDVCPTGFMYATCVLVEFPHSKVQLSELPKGYYPIVLSTWSFTTSLAHTTGQSEKI